MAATRASDVFGFAITRRPERSRTTVTGERRKGARGLGASRSNECEPRRGTRQRGEQRRPITCNKQWSDASLVRGPWSLPTRLYGWAGSRLIGLTTRITSRSHSGHLSAPLQRRSFWTFDRCEAGRIARRLKWMLTRGLRRSQEDDHEDDHEEEQGFLLCPLTGVRLNMIWISYATRVAHRGRQRWPRACFSGVPGAM
jgi:hypothetical protein